MRLVSQDFCDEWMENVVLFLRHATDLVGNMSVESSKMRESATKHIQSRTGDLEKQVYFIFSIFNSFSFPYTQEHAFHGLPHTL